MTDMSDRAYHGSSVASADEHYKQLIGFTLHAIGKRGRAGYLAIVVQGPNEWRAHHHFVLRDPEDNGPGHVTADPANGINGKIIDAGCVVDEHESYLCYPFIVVDVSKSSIRFVDQKGNNLDSLKIEFLCDEEGNGPGHVDLSGLNHPSNKNKEDPMAAKKKSKKTTATHHEPKDGVCKLVAFDDLEPGMIVDAGIPPHPSIEGAKPHIPELYFIYAINSNRPSYPVQAHKNTFDGKPYKLSERNLTEHFYEPGMVMVIGSYNTTDGTILESYTDWPLPGEVWTTTNTKRGQVSITEISPRRPKYPVGFKTDDGTPRKAARHFFAKRLGTIDPTVTITLTKAEAVALVTYLRGDDEADETFPASDDETSIIFAIKEAIGEK